MNNIKSFIYLDEYKMFSISSQLFEGLTEYILSGKNESLSESDNQKGHFGSGRVMGDILTIEKNSLEKRFLHDYAFNIFEKELVNRDMLYTPSDKNNIEDLKNKSFIKIKGKIFFNDYKAVTDTLKDFNSISRGLNYIQFYTLNGEINPEMKEQIGTLLNNNSKTTLNRKEMDRIFTSFLKNRSVIFEENWIKHMIEILQYGYKNSLEILLPVPAIDVLFSSILNREYLKEDIDSLIYKYSRKSEVEFTVLGSITQIGNDRADINCIPGTGNDFKLASRNVLNMLAQVEDTFIGRLDSECIIDPIAIYRDL